MNVDKYSAECEPMCSKSVGVVVATDETLNSEDNANLVVEDKRKFIPIIIAKTSAAPAGTRTTPTIFLTSDDDGGGGGEDDGKGTDEIGAAATEDDVLLSPTDQLTITSLRSLGLLSRGSRNNDEDDDDDDDSPYKIPSWNAFALSDPAAQSTVKSIASLGLGSSDGRNLYVRRVPSSASILINNKAAVRRSIDDGVSLEGSSYFSETASGHRFRRKHWRNKAEFILACIGFTVGFGNIWRFPYLAYRSGGGAFLVPYFVTLLLCGIPLLYMELAVGQFTRRGPVGAMQKICPLFKGAGVASLIISFIMSTYSVVIIAWALYYLVASFNSTLPWQGCGNEWNTADCWDPFNFTKAEEKSVRLFNRSSATQEFYDGKVLQRTEGIEFPGVLRGELVLCLFGAWVLVYFVLWKSVRSSGKVVYLTAVFPYILLIAFLVFALTLPGADAGLRFFFRPKWDLLLDAKVWVNAAAQNFNAVGLAMGSIMTFSSYNKFSNNILTDTMAIALTNALTSVLVGITVFSMLGHIALEQRTTVDDVVTDGPGLIFVIYPQVLVKMPVPHVWSVLFFTMLLCVALDNEFAMVEVVITSIRDGFPKFVAKYFKRHEILVLVVVLISFVFGLPNVLQGGIYIFQLLDDYAARFSLMYLAFFETLAIIWIYGTPRLCRNIQEMTGTKPSPYFIFCWRFAAPVLILLVWIFSFIDYEPPTYDNGKILFPAWVEAVGWLIASCSLVTIPIFAILQIRKAPGSTFLERLKSSVQSTIHECSLCGFTRTCPHEESEWNQRNSIMTTNLTPIFISEQIVDKVSTL